MSKVFERFDLDLERIMSSSEIKSKVIPQKRELLRQDIYKKKHILLEGENQFNGIPKTIIVGGDYGSGIKEDVDGILLKLGLPYKHIELYFEISK